MNNPLVSIIIPTFSRPKNLCRAIESVLKQTYTPIEIIVVDDNGEGTPYQIETESLLKDYISTNRVNYIKHKFNKNGSAARNTGVKESHGVYIGLLDDDDVFDPEKIERQVNYLEDNKSKTLLKGVYCNTMCIEGNKISYRHNQKSGQLFEELLLGKVDFNSSTILLYKETYLELNGFDERYKRNQDWEFCLRYFKRYSMDVVNPEMNLITKYSTPNTDSIDPYNAINRLEFFLDNFKEDIQRLQSANLIYYHHYEWLTRLLLSHGYLKESYRYYKKMKSYKKVGIRKHLGLVKLYIRSF